MKKILFAVFAFAVSLCAFANNADYRPGTAPFKFETTPGALSKDVIPRVTRVEFDLDPYATHFSGRVVHTIEVKRATRSIVLNTAELELSNATLNDSTPLTIAIDEKTQLVTLTAPHTAEPGQHRVALSFKGKLGASGYGLYYAQYQTDDKRAKRMIATQFQAIGARRALPCFDEPAFRAVWEIAITSDKKYTAVSNMPVKRETVEGEKRRVEFEPTPSMASYLAAVAVGELEKTTDRFDNTELGIYTVAGRHRDLAYAMQSTKQVLGYFKDYFGSPYPLPKLDQIAVPGKRGAMENWGLITYSEGLLSLNPATASTESKFFSFLIIAHEIAHQWFGNLVTMGWWDGLWLNESFAEWMSHKATAALNPDWNVSRRLNDARGEAMVSDALASAKPIERGIANDRQSDELFDAITYQKGHAVLSMIERYAGEEKWRDGLRDYFKKHAYGSTTSADLWAAIGQRTDANVQAFATSWTQQAGFPLVNADIRCERDKQTLRLSQSRFELKRGYVPPQQWNVALLVKNVTRNTAAEPVFLSSVAQSMDAGRCGDAIVVDAGAGGYFRVRYNADAQRALSAHASKALATNVAKISTADRARMLTDAWALAEIGVQSPRVALDQIASLKANDDALLWIEAVDVYTRTAELVREGEELASLYREARTVFAKPFAQLGWTPRAGESDVAQILRSRLISMLAQAGEAAVLARSREVLSSFAKDEKSVDGNIASGAIRAVGFNATRADVDAIVAMLMSGKYPAMEWALAEALAATRDQDVARYALSFALSDSLPRTVVSRLIGRVASVGLQDRLAVEFTAKHFDAIAAKGGRFSWRYIVAAPLRNSRDMKLAEEIKTLATARLEEEERLETLRAVASVERNHWAYEAIRGKIARR